MTIERARELLWDLVADRSDEEMKDFLANSKRFVNIILDHTEDDPSLFQEDKEKRT